MFPESVNYTFAGTVIIKQLSQFESLEEHSWVADGAAVDDARLDERNAACARRFAIASNRER
jgi:hypothetical protein